VGAAGPNVWYSGFFGRGVTVGARVGLLDEGGTGFLVATVCGIEEMCG
jgi:hypothetical protein